MEAVTCKTVTKRVRSSNFSSAEKSVLLNIISKYKAIIENKKTDCITNEEKASAWDKITCEFNAISPNLCSRSTDSLKKWFDNKKKEIRKDVAKEKVQTFLTGGGLPEPGKKDENHELVLSIIDKSTVYGTANQWDSDGQRIISKLNADSVTVYEFEQDEIPDSAVNDTTNVSMSGYEITSECEKVIPNSEIKTTWKTYCPKHLQLPTSSTLTPLAQKRSSGSEANSTSKKTKFEVSRRRPATQVKALTTSEIAKKYDVLMERRLELADLTKQSLLLDIEIKKAELNKLTRSNEENNKLYSRLMCIDLRKKTSVVKFMLAFPNE